MITAIKGEVKLEGSASEIMTDACMILTSLNNKGLLKPTMEVFTELLEMKHPIFDIEPDVDKTWVRYEE